MARGCRCFAVFIDGAVAGYGWLSMGPEWIGELQLEITPNPREGYIWDCATLVEHRRKGIFHSLLVGISDVARREGLKRLWIGTIAVPAEKVLEPSGFRPALRFIVRRVGGWQVLRVVTASSDRKLVAAARAALEPRADFLLRRSEHRVH
jgi:GNAT superfamily N-acetyltransferase